MPFNLDELRALSTSEKLRLVEFLWDDLGSTEQVIPLPDWVLQEGDRRRKEMVEDPALGLTHHELWQRINGRS